MSALGHSMLISVSAPERGLSGAAHLGVGVGTAEEVLLPGSPSRRQLGGGAGACALPRAGRGSHRPGL